MKAVVTRVQQASVEIEGKVCGAIGQGFLVLLGVGPDDDEASCDRLAEKVAHVRVFSDEAGKMNLSIDQVGGAFLVISQFTLYADLKKRRPGFSHAAKPELAEPLYERFMEKKMVVDVWEGTNEIVEELPIERKYPFKSGVNIMFGCNNFCSYCIVPYVRGRERSREPEDIIKEIEDLVADGVVEVMLLGQNVNSYGKNLEQPITFAELLRRVEKIEGLERIRFMTSHPKDLSDELIETMKNSKKICSHLHLPLQSGSSEILKRMNRKYSKEQYLALVEKLRAAMPDISLTTDIIVGFPGETEEDFEETMDVVRKVRYDSAFTFIYSKRTGTPAAAMPNQVPEDVVKNRFDRLLREVQDIAAEVVKRHEGTVQKVLVEEIDTHEAGFVTGRLSNNTVVHFAGDASLIGKIVDVSLDEAKGFYYMGSLVK